MTMKRNGGRCARAISTAVLAGTLVAGCAGNGGAGGGMSGVMGTDTGKGALFGGATGALIGGLVDHADPAVGILIGAAGGALAGGLIGHHMDTHKQNLAQVLAPEVNAGNASVELLKNHAVLVNMTGNTRFAPGSAVVNPAFLSALQKVASVAKTYGKITITVIGHPDKGGSAAARETLAQQRAEAVRVQLLGMGVPAILVSASGNPRSTWEDGRAELVIHPVIGG
ncbi:MAG TPA: OmpA family protein [Burkholderiales bacterium]|jgi:outer membrane protein OmpA-like peptidoglycan-associated protein|nr:OmpA family protein [Burkholderiales bacterium]